MLRIDRKLPKRSGVRRCKRRHRLRYPSIFTNEMFEARLQFRLGPSGNVGLTNRRAQTIDGG